MSGHRPARRRDRAAGPLAAELTRVLGDGRVSQRAIDRYGTAHDASHYLLVPHTVVTPRGRDEVVALIDACRRFGVPLTFRSGGTSLSGQAVTDQVLADTRPGFRSVEVLDDGARVRARPGSTIRSVNARLARRGRRLGPDPASELACTVGGVVANNSSGMQCGTTANTYATIEAMELVLPDGRVIDTAAPGAGDRFARDEPELHAGLTRLRDRVRSDPESVATLRRQFAMKNTMGYGLNAFLDHDDPLDILVHLVVGSEGTLAFVASATFRTVPVLPHAATGLLVFPDLRAAIDAVPEAVHSGAAAVELLDRASLAVSQRGPHCPQVLRGLALRDEAALLVEYQGATPGELAEAEAGARPVLGGPGAHALTRDARERAELWQVRKGLYSAVAAARPTGTNALLEDVVVPPARLAETAADLTGLFAEHGYDGSVLFGHAKDGNLHFLLNERFDDPAAIRRYEAFTDDMVDLVLGKGGSLKAEHGTGRIMAPFVRRQYGDELHAVMRAVKHLIDPAGILNPGAVFSDDPGSYLRDLKTADPVEAEVDRCVECGYCEPVCPSRDLTTTPRQRIVLRRELAAAERRGDHDLVAELERDTAYEVVQTCAVDGMCAHSCPVGINTGDLVRRLRAEDESRTAAKGWQAAARHWSGVTRSGAAALSAARSVPSAVPAAVTAAARRVLGADAVPLYADGLPAGGRRRTVLRSPDARAVLFASCTGSMFGPEPGSPGVTDALLAVCGRAGIALRTAADPETLCCGMPWKSKGHTDGYAVMRERVLDRLHRATEGGRLPVVVDASSCASGLLTTLEGSERGRVLTVVDAVTFVADEVLPRLTVTPRWRSLAVHPTCSTTALASTEALERIGAAVAEEVHVPLDWGCCGFAGDRGLLHPELTAAATAPEAAEIRAGDFDAYASCNRTCEVAMTRTTGHPYRHIIELLADCLPPRTVSGD